MYVPYQEIYRNHGRQGGVEFLTITHRLLETDGKFSTRLQEGRAFKVAADLVEPLRKHFDNWEHRMRGKKRLIDGSGREVIKPDAAIASLDADDKPAKAQGKRTVANFVPVDVKRVIAYRKQLNKLKDGQMDLFAGDSHKDIDAINDRLGRLMDGAHPQDGRLGIIHRYEEAPAGRLFAQGVNLQNSRSEIKEVILSGHWEYDIENCHYTILHHMARAVRLTLPHISHYLDNKKAVRNQIAAEVGIGDAETKTCLTSLLYGSTESEWKLAAVPKVVGIDAARRLYKHPIYRALKGDVGKARKKILAKWPRSRLRLENAMGKWISEEEAHRSILAHLLQGVEAKMLEVVRLLYPGQQIQLMQHDGFTSNVRLDVDVMQAAILEQTGYSIKLEEKRLAPRPSLGVD